MRSLLAAVSLLAATAAPAAAQAPTADRLEREGVREIIVKRASGLSASERGALRRRADVELVELLPLPRTEVVAAEPGRLAEAIEALEDDPGVVRAEPNRPVRALVPDDPRFPDQWGLENTGQLGGLADADIDAPEAWQHSLGAGQVVAVIDSGVRLAHADLADRLGEDGYDWVGDDTVPEDEEGHGTHVAGTIAATAGNGTGVAGVAPAATVLPLRVLDADGSGSTGDLIQAIDYAGQRGVAVVNLSLGGVGPLAAERDALARHPDTLFVVAAGNGASTNDADPTTAEYPCSYDLPNVLCVGASTRTEQRATYSNYGATTVDLFAPGSAIWSTHLASEYHVLSGTSMATPHVSGVAALVRAAVPGIGTAAIKAALLDSADRRPAYAGLSVTGARLNAAAAVTAALASTPGPQPSAAPDQPVPVPQPEPTPEPVAPAPPAPPAEPIATPAPVSAPRSGSAWLTVTVGRPRGRRLGRVSFSAAGGLLATRALQIERPAGRHTVELCATPAPGGAPLCARRTIRARDGRLAVPAMRLRLTPGRTVGVSLAVVARGQQARTRGAVELGV